MSVVTASLCRGVPAVVLLLRHGDTAAVATDLSQGSRQLNPEHETQRLLRSATNIPSPCLKGIIAPVRLRPPSGKMMKIAFSSCNF